MKLLHTILLLVGLFVGTTSAAQTKVLRAYAHRVFDVGNGQTTVWDSITLVYNPLVQKTEQSFYWSWNASSQHWKTIRRWKDYTYDAQGNTLYFLTQSGDDTNGWTDDLRTNRTYDPENRLLGDVTEYWSGTKWDTASQKHYSYDFEGKVLLFTQNSDHRSTYTYDVQDRLTETFSEIKTPDGFWRSGTKTFYEYGSNGKLETTTIYAFVDSISTPYSKHTESYDGAGTHTQSLSQTWKNGIWENLTLDTYQYDVTGNVIEDLVQGWQDGTWQNYYHRRYAFDDASNLLTDWTEIYKAGSWLRSVQYNFYYTEIVPTGESTPLTFQMFPNPATSFLCLKGAALTHLNIYSQDGKCLYSQTFAGNDQYTMPLQLPAGQYILKVIDHKGNMATKPLRVIR